MALTDRDDLRDPTITEQRDNLTSATNRLGEANASLRPGFVAAAGLMRAMQQKAYPELEDPVADLVRQAAKDRQLPHHCTGLRARSPTAISRCR